jgi:hypothetical protein
VRVASGSVTSLGFASLVRVTSELHDVAGLDLANTGLADERCYHHLTRALQEGDLGHLNVLRLSNMQLGDSHICALARALYGHQELEILCVAGNTCALASSSCRAAELQASTSSQLKTRAGASDSVLYQG